MPAIASDEQMQWAAEFRRCQALYTSNRDLISVGAYQPGTNPALDQAVTNHLPMQAFLDQDMQDAQSLEHSLQQLAGLIGAMRQEPPAPSA